jgi:hypothetical protein
VKALWNINLLKEVVAAAYVEIIVEFTKKVHESAVAEFYAIWPDVSNTTSPFDVLAQAFYFGISDKPVLYSKANSGTWISAAEAFFVDSSVNEVVVQTLIAGGIPVVLPPHHVLHGLESVGLVQRKVNPSLLR